MQYAPKQHETADKALCIADTSIGLWMLAFDVSYFDDTRLCAFECMELGVAFWQIECTGALFSLFCMVGKAHFNRALVS